MGTNFLTNIDWSSPATIGIGIAIIAVIVIGGYLWWAWSKKEWGHLIINSTIANWMPSQLLFRMD